MQLLPLVRLGDKQTNNIIARTVHAPDTYLVPLQIQGNSLFSSVWVKSIAPGATLLVSYFETTTGNLGEERVDIVSHEIITAAQLDPVYGFTAQRTVTPFHNKPICEITLTGGSAEFGIYVTVIDTFASDMDAALVFDNELADLSKDKAIPIAGLDASNRFQMLQVVDGALRVQAEIVEAGSSSTPVFQFGAVLGVVSNVLTEIMTLSVPLTKKIAIKNVSVSGDNIATYFVVVGVDTVAVKRTYFGSSLNELFEFANALTLDSSQSLTVFVEHKRPSLGSFHAYIVGTQTEA